MSTSTDIDTTVLNDLDFSIQQACEHEQHHIWHIPDGPAVMYVRRLGCKACGYNNEGRPAVIALCQSGWDRAAPPAMLQCNSCGEPDFRDEYWRYLGPINA